VLPDRWNGSGPDCFTSGRFILLARLGSGGRAERRSANAWREARAVRCAERAIYKVF